MRPFLFLLSLSWATLSTAQFHQSVLSDLEGQELLDRLKQDFKPTSPLPSNQARDVMFSTIDNQNDSVTCVYTGYRIYVNPNDDPSQAAFMNGAGLNTEHTYPQGLGATGLAAGDLHHLFPTRVDVNGDRGSFPFGELPDNFTTTWYYLDQEMSNIPNSNIDLYSEWRNGVFEPREDHKGDVARAMMYFYTMYKAQADGEDPNFFNDQLDVFCDWHTQDPVDEKEWNRTFRVADFQNNKPNPFVLDCSLAGRAYCEEVDMSCLVIATEEIEETVAFSLQQNSPNPFSDFTTIRYQLDQTFEVNLRVLNHLRQEIVVLVNERQFAGQYKIPLSLDSSTPKGLLFYELELKNGDAVYRTCKKMLHL